MHDFRKGGPNVIESDEGTITTTGRAGVEVTYRGRNTHINSEMLHPPMTIALFVGGGDGPADEEAIRYAIAGLTWAGFEVEVQ
jgi:hypothetical protein